MNVKTLVVSEHFMTFYFYFCEMWSDQGSAPQMNVLICAINVAKIEWNILTQLRQLCLLQLCVDSGNKTEVKQTEARQERCHYSSTKHVLV